MVVDAAELSGGVWVATPGLGVVGVVWPGCVPIEVLDCAAARPAAIKKAKQAVRIQNISRQLPRKPFSIAWEATLQV